MEGGQADRTEFQVSKATQGRQNKVYFQNTEAVWLTLRKQEKDGKLKMLTGARL